MSQTFAKWENLENPLREIRVTHFHCHSFALYEIPFLARWNASILSEANRCVLLFLASLKSSQFLFWSIGAERRPRRSRAEAPCSERKSCALLPFPSHSFEIFFSSFENSFYRVFSVKILLRFSDFYYRQRRSATRRLTKKGVCIKATKNFSKFCFHFEKKRFH